MTSDLDLLRQFVRENSQDAFGQIVRRHLDLVYSAALRLVRSPQLAEEIAQSVFADLAGSAGKVSGSGVPPVSSLAPWLYTVTRRTAIDVIRKESRRQLRERITVEMNNMNATTNDWKQIEPLLDDAMAALEETDRSAILLRYFQNKSLREVGEALGASEEAAQKRVSRAVEKLREFFSKRNVAIGSGGLAVLISANAVQCAPAGLATAISAAAILTGTTLSSSTAVLATKTFAMTALHKTIIAAAFAVTVGMGIYETYQVSQLRMQIQTLQQQQAPLTEQIQQLRRARDDATNRLASAIAKNEQLKTNPNENELLSLRSEVTRLRADQAKKEDHSTATAARSWLDRVNRLKDYLKLHPEKTIPEFQFLSVQRWLNAVEAGGPQTAEITNLDERYHAPISDLRSFAKDDFGFRVELALQKYAAANQGQFPTDLSQLQPYCDPHAEALLEKFYEIKPASILPADQVKQRNIKTDWVVVRKHPAAPNSTSRVAFWAGGQISCNLPPGGKKSLIHNR